MGNLTCVPMAKDVRVKKPCCKSRPRCKRCPVTLARLAQDGLAIPSGKRTYKLTGKVRKKDMKAARAR